ncbi:hypothetical protein SAMN05421796_10289 [Chryseobacterium piscicola]|jgi:hypothetical protein|uniref:Uncharacterized protein n=1 Tax=Chryseobacterium piscicola TaxID=551459 RepID=A0A1N7L7L3_9FLAO|nr:hypothetical protein [Chryseobacterium piscicola]PQA97420.1 hypothetical protein B0A70_01780 [Chryseobacterium piscicola]SIS69829.1 hypothetical protein SAMN05421796_10289 [Chryseobacterium piscicola]
MKTPVKFALGIAAAVVVGGITAFGLRKKRSQVLKTFTAPDGNTYPQDHIYRTFDNQYYRNGKKIKIKTPVNTNLENRTKHNTNSAFEGAKNHEAPTPHVDYHQRGVRNR